ncbi:hypothetical protein GCM10023184_31460 [Flaviaesturariibacter amylovorans]|uniref:DoxX family protein n=1 Tax=Flaviaesturariibacter amylovorans TaxID=1084520 RepID=A0ABP8H9J7_9BACT
MLLPFPWRLAPFWTKLTTAVFDPLLTPLALTLDPGHRSAYPVSDSLQQWLLAGLLLLAAILPALLLNRRAGWVERRERAQRALRAGLSLYLATVLLVYGCDKLFKAQFYLPEPNTLYTPLGQLDKDILYWSTVGTSYSYNLFLGGTEVLAAVLVFFTRTRRAGLLLTAGTMAQVLAVNLCFGITVVLFSGFLLFVSLLLLAPDAGRLFAVLSGRAAAAAPVVPRAPLWCVVLKAFIGFLALAEALYPSLRSGHWNDDRAPRPLLHGAYEVLSGALSPTIGPPPVRLFVHRRGYLVFQDSAGFRSFPLQVRDEHLVVTYPNGRTRTTVPYVYHLRDSVLTVMRPSGDTVLLRARMLDWRSLPALR